MNFSKFNKVGLKLVAVAVVLALVLSVNMALCIEVISASERMESYDGKYYADYSSQEQLREAAEETNMEIAGESFILMKNNGLLPLAMEKVSLFGKQTAELTYGGTGSGGGSGGFDLESGLAECGIEINPKLVAFYADNSRSGGFGDAAGMSGGSWSISETPVSAYGPSIVATYGAYDDAAIVVFSRSGGEGADLARENVEGTAEDRHYLELAPSEEALLDHVQANFENVIVLINSANVMELGKLEEDADIDAILWIGQIGYNGAAVVGDVLTGKINPSGRTVDIWTADHTQDPTWQNFGDNSHVESSHRYFSVDDPNTEANEAMSNVSPTLEYEEGIYLGYKYYETRAQYEEAGWYDEHVVYPFGYGLSYTTFAWEIDEAKSTAALEKDGKVNIVVDVTNTGDVAGKDVVEIYVQAPYTAGGIEKSHVALVGFAKTSLLAPGASEEVTVTFDVKDMASYDDVDKNNNSFKGYELEAGEYTIHASKNSHESVDTISYTVATGFQYATDEATGNDSSPKFVGKYTTLNGTMVEMSRADFEGTFPVAPTEAELTLAVTSDVYKALRYGFNLGDDETEEKWYKTVADIPANWTQAASAQGRTITLTLADMIGKDKNHADWDLLLNQLTYTELLDLAMTGRYKTARVDAIGKIQARDQDGPAQLKAAQNGTIMWVCETNIASTWNVDLAYAQGIIVGNEGLLFDCQGWYAPAMNIHRSAFSGRNFEYYSQDGVHGGLIAAAVVKGCQSKGLYAYIKHFAINDQETDRTGIATWCTEQAAREIYMRNFEYAVKKGGAMAVMSSFNRIGAIAACNNYALLTEILRDEWGFQGHVVTDYWSGSLGSNTMNTELLARAGNDIPLGDVASRSRARGEWDASLRGGKGDVIYENVEQPTQYYVIRQAAKNVLFTSANSNTVRNGYDLSLGGTVNLTQYSAGNVAVAEFDTADVVFSTTSTLPEGVSLNSAGVLSGTPREAGSFSVRVTAVLDGWVTISGTVNLVVASPFSYTGAATATVGTPYSGVVSQNAWTVAGDVTEVTLSVRGSLPAGLSFDAATGTISGTPTVGGEHTITIRCAVTSETINSSGRPQTSTSNYDYVITLNIIDNTEYVTVSFDGEEQVIVSGGTATAPEAPTKEGYTFVGWEDAKAHMF